MLGHGPDGFGLLGGGWVGVSQPGRWFEQGATQVLEQPQPAGVMVNPRQPRDARSSTAQTRVTQLVSPGSRPMTLTRRRVSPNVRSMKLECRTRLQCSRGKRR